MLHESSDFSADLCQMTESEHEIFTELYVANEQAMYGFVYSLLHSRPDADDVIQETMAQLWEHFDKYDRSRPFLPWANRFAYRQVLMHRRRESVRRIYLSEDVLRSLAQDYPETAGSEESRRRALKTCLQTLTDRQRELLKCRYESEEPLVEIADRLDRTVNSLYKSLQRIRQILVRLRRTPIGGGDRAMIQELNRDRLVALVGQLCDQDIDEAELAELEDMLRDSKQARDLYHLTVALNRDLELCEIVGVGSTESTKASHNESTKRPARKRATVTALPLVLAASILLIVSAVGFYVFRSGTNTTQVATIAAVTDLIGVEWAEGQTQIKLGDEISPRRLNFVNGTVFLTYKQGVVVAIEGPADLELVAKDHAILHEGQLVAYVPEGAEGFRVSTDAANIVDLGTEFGVTARQDGSSDVIVFDGEVELAPKNASQADQRRVVAGLAYRVERDGTTHQEEFRQSGFEESRSILRRRKLIREPFRKDELFPGTARNGWAGPWELDVENLTVNENETGIHSDAPLVSESKNYLTIVGHSGDNGEPGSVRLHRLFDSFSQFDSTQPYTVEFLFRLESDPAGIEQIHVFGIQVPVDAENDRTDWRAGTALRKDSDDLRWQLYRPQATTTNTLPLVQGQTYRFLIEVHPQHLRWRASISDGTHAIWNTIKDGEPLRLRTGELTNHNTLGWEIGTASGLELRFSLDAIFIQNNPTAALESRP